MEKKWLLILSALLVLLIIGGLFFFFFSGKSNPLNDAGDDGSIGLLRFLGLSGNKDIDTDGSPPPSPTPGPGTTPDGPGDGTGQKEARLIQITTKGVIGPALTKDGAGISYYVRAGGNLEEMALDGKNVRIVSPLTILGMFDVLWSPTRTKSVLSYADDDLAKRFISEPGGGSPVVFLPQALTATAWSPDGTSLAYFLPQGTANTNLVVASHDGKNPKVVYSTPIPDLTLFWPTKTTILLPSRPSGIAPGVLFSFNTNTKAATVVLDSAYGLTILPSPKGTAMLYAVTNDRGRDPSLFLANITGESATKVSVTTLPEKCVFTTNEFFAYCAIPKNIASFSILPDDWYMGVGFFEDRLIKIDTKTLATETVFDERSFDMTNMFLSSDEQHLFFQDKHDNTLWRLRIVP